MMPKNLRWDVIMLLALAPIFIRFFLFFFFITFAIKMMMIASCGYSMNFIFTNFFLNNKSTIYFYYNTIDITNKLSTYLMGTNQD